MNAVKLRVISLGAGVQSSTMALMAARGEIGPMPDCASWGSERTRRPSRRMRVRAYYNEIDPFAAYVLRCLIEDGVIAPGDVDERSIADVEPNDLKGYTQAHFFAGGGLWSVAVRLARWPDDRPIWTGSCPCQPFSVAGKGLGENDPRHLWPHFFRLIRARRPSVVVGEQVAGSAGYRWFDGVAADLEREDYACRAVDIPACAVDAPHIRQRLYWVAVDDPMRGRYGTAQKPIRAGRGGFELSGRVGSWHVADAASVPQREQDDAECAVSWENAWVGFSGSSSGHASGHMADADRAPGRQVTGCAFGHEKAYGRARRDNGEPDGNNRHSGNGEGVSFWSDAEWRTGADGKARRAKPGICLLANGIPNRASALRLAGNAIVPQVAAEVIGALMDDLT